MARRALSEQDRAAWAGFARGITRLPGRAAPEPLPDPPGQEARVPEAGRLSSALRPPSRPGAGGLAVGVRPGGLDGGTWNRLRSGRLAPARTLDLHGRTAQMAFHALHAFLVAAHADRVRCVEIITGRGSGEAGGVIRRELPHWLDLPTLRPLVLAAHHPHPANPGAVRLLLRRRR